MKTRHDNFLSFLIAKGLTLTDLECLPVVIQSVQSPFRITLVFTICVFSRVEAQGEHGVWDIPQNTGNPDWQGNQIAGNCFHDLAN